MSSTLALRIVAVVTLLVGATAALAADLVLFTHDDTCPQWEDEGPMAAPGSPYSLLMCGPDDPPLVWAVYAGIALAGALSLVLLVRRPRRLVAVALVLGVLLGPAATVGVLHLTLPRDCLSGATDSGDCVRDRELR